MEMTPYKYYVVPGLFPYNMFLKGPLFHCESQHKRSLASHTINVFSFSIYNWLYFFLFEGQGKRNG